MLAHTEWNKRRACAILDISRPTLDRKIEEYGLRRDDAAPAERPSRPAAPRGEA